MGTPSFTTSDLQNFLAGRPRSQTGNSQYAKPGPYTTKLSPDEEKGFQGWVKQKSIPWQDAPNADYDMRGFYRAMRSGDPRATRAASNQHFPDIWKTPYHKSFSNESIYATKDAPRWRGNKLVDRSGRVLFDEDHPDAKPAAPKGAFTTTDLQKFLAGQQKPPIQRAFESIPGVKSTEQFAEQQAKYWTGLKDRQWGTAEHRGPLQRTAQDFLRSKEWQQLNTPFYADPRKVRQAELHRQFHDRLLASKERWSVPHQLLQSAIEGIGDQINGMFTPVNAALLLGLEGMGAEGRRAIQAAGAEAEGAEGLRLAQQGAIRDEASMKAAEKAARSAGNAAARDMEERLISSTPLGSFTAQRAIQSLASLGFSAQMLSQVKPAFDQAEAAFKQGDIMTGTRSAIDAVSGLVFGLGAGVHAVGEAGGIRREWRNEADVRKSLQVEAKEKYGKDWTQLNQQEKADVTYSAVSKYGPEEQRKFYRTIQGLPKPPVTDEVAAAQDRFLDAQAQLDERSAALAEVAERPMPQMNADDVAYEKGVAERQAWAERQKAVQAKIDSREPLEVRDRIVQGEPAPMVPPKPLGYDERRNTRGILAQVPKVGETRKEIVESWRKGEALQRWQQQKADEKIQQRRQEMAAIPAPPRTVHTPETASEMDFGPQPMTPLEREVARDDERRQVALRELEDERALQAREARGIEEEPEETPGIPHIERRSIRDMAQIEDEIRRSIPQAAEIRSVEEHGYERMTEDLRRLGHDLYPEEPRGAEPAMVYERLRRKSFEGDILHDGEERFMSLYARRQQVEKSMIDKGSRAAASKLFDSVVRADVQRIMKLADREGKMFDVAFDLQREAMRAKTMEDADFWATQSNVALDTAERLRAEREAEQARRTAMLDPDQFVPNDTPIYKLRGEETEIVLPDRRRVKAYYAAVPVNRVIPSHDPFSWDWNEKYKPRKMQIRDLSVEEEARAETMRMGNNFDADEYLSDTTTADHGPSIISEDGRLIGGNRRMLAQLLALNTEQRAKIIQAMVRGAKKFNVPVDDRFFDEDFPMTIVRVVRQMPEAAAEAIRLGHDMNRDYIQGFNADAKAVVDATRLTMDDMETIARWIEQLPGDEESQSVTKLLATRPQEVFDLMVQKGIIPPNKTVEYMREGKLTDRAMETFKNLIRGKVIDDANLLMLSKEARLKAIDRAIVPLLKIKQLTPDWNISDYLKNALKIWVDIERVRDEIDMVGKAGDSAVDRYYHPEQFKDARGFSGAPLLIPREVHPISLALAKLFELAPLRFKEALWDYADEGEGKQVRLLEAATPVESFNQHIGEKVNVEVSPVDWGTIAPASEERKEAFEKAEKRRATPAEQKKAETPLEPNTAAVIQEETRKLQAAAENGTVTPEALQQFFEADPRFRDMAPMLMHIFGRVIPRATQMTLAEFLQTRLLNVRTMSESEYRFGEPGQLAQDDEWRARRGEIWKEVTGEHPEHIALINELRGEMQKEGVGAKQGVRQDNAYTPKINELIGRRNKLEREMHQEYRARVKAERPDYEDTEPPPVSAIPYEGEKHDLGPLPKGGPYRGVTEWANKTQAMITLFEKAEVSTVLHEFFHLMRPFINDADTKTLATWAYTELDKRGVKVPAGKWTRDMEEILARAWERYWWDGKAPDSGLAAIFERIKSAMRSIYLAATGRNAKVPRGTPIDQKISKEVRTVFDRWIAGEEMKPPRGIEEPKPPLLTWFGKSQVVDEGGNPQLVHHQTWNEITGDFDRLWAANYFKRDTEGTDTMGIWFSDHPDLSKYGPRNVDAYLKIENPLVLEDGEGRENSAFMKLHKMVEKAGGSTNLRKRLKSEGYDGVLFKDAHIDIDKANTWLAFEPDQIRVERQTITEPEKVKQNEELRKKNEAKRAAAMAPPPSEKPIHQMTLKEYMELPESKSVPAKSALALKPEEFTHDRLQEFSFKDLQPVAMLLKVSKSGSKSEVIGRILDRLRLKADIKDATVESLMAMKGDALRRYVKDLGVYGGGNKESMAKSIIGWREDQKKHVHRSIAETKHRLAVEKALAAGQEVPEENLREHRLGKFEGTTPEAELRTMASEGIQAPPAEKPEMAAPPAEPASQPIPKFLEKDTFAVKRWVRRTRPEVDEAERQKAMQTPAPRNGTQVAPTQHPMTYMSGHHSSELAKLAAERGDIGLMLTPSQARYLDSADQYPVIALDNGAFGKEGFKETQFMRMVDGIASNPALKAKVRFVVAPDAPMDAAGTLEKFDAWADRLHQLGLPVALAAQNGMEKMDIPWDKVDVLFLGGDTDWKVARNAPEEFYKMLHEAEDRGIPLHMGRVNSNQRMDLAAFGLGASTVDGTYLKHGPEKNMANVEAWLNEQNRPEGGGIVKAADEGRKERMEAAYRPTEKPLATGGKTSYRYKGRYGWIMIAADSEEEALQEAKRSLSDPSDRKNLSTANLQKFDGGEYRSVEEEVTAPITQPEQMELLAPPESVETDITPEEREALQPAFFGPKHANEVDGEQRLKRTDTIGDLQSWAVKNKDRLKGMTAWTLPDGRAVAYYVPEDPNVLFQGGETLMDLYRQLRDIREMRDRIAKRGGPVQNLDRQIAEIQQKIDKQTGAPKGAILGMTAPPAQKLVLPGEPERGKIEQPLIRPEQNNLFRPLILPREEEEVAKTAQQPRTVPDDSVRVQDRGGAGRGDRLAGGPEPRRTAEAGVSAGRRPGEPVSGRRDVGANTLSKAVPVNLASPLRRTSEPIVERGAWRSQVESVGLPPTLPPITHRLADEISRILIFPGQREIADSAYSALHVFDGTVIASPTGTGKTFTGLAVAKQFYDDGQKKILIISKNPSILKQEKGWMKVAKDYFGMPLKDLPRTQKEIGEEPYAATYQGLLRNPWAAQVPWDLVVFDESAEARRWYESAQGDMARRLSDASKKAVYISATPFHNAVEYGYMTKLGLWNARDMDVPSFDAFARQFGAVRNVKGGWARLGGEWPNRLLKLREQLIERGQFITQNKDYRGNTSQFALVPLSQKNRVDLMRGQQAFLEAENFFNLQQNPGLAGVARRVAVTWTKNYIERARLTQVTDMMRSAAKRQWQVVLFSENANAREEVYNFMKEADAAMGGRLSQLLPPFEGVQETLTRDLGEKQVANFTGPDNPARRAALKDFLDGRKQFLFATYGAGSTGLNLHDDSEGGLHPRMAIYLGPPYSGIMFEQSQGRLWRFGTTSDVHNIFMTSDAAPELHMLLTKIAPRLESLKAAVNGVDGTDPLIQRLKSLKKVQEESMGYDLGAEVEWDAKQYAAVEDKVPIADWMNALQQIPDGEKAKGAGKGMRFKGREEMEAKRKAEKHAQFAKLFQDDGEINPEARMVSPEEARANDRTRDEMRNLVEGEAVPVAGDALRDVNRGTRELMADAATPTIQERVRSRQEAGAEGVAQSARRTAFTQMLVAHRAGEVDSLAEDKEANWEMRTPGEPKIPPDDQSSRVKTNYFFVSGRSNMFSVAKQAGKPEIGQQIVRKLMSYLAARAGYAGEWTSRYEKILADNQIKGRDQHRLLWDVKEGKLPPPTQKLARAAQQITELMNEIRRRAAEKGLYLQDYDDDGRKVNIYYADILDNPTYMPHIHDYNEKIRVKDSLTGETHIFTLKQLLGGTLGDLKRDRILAAIERETGVSRYEIEKRLKNRQRKTPLAGNLERARSADLPFYRKDKGAMVRYFESAGELFARADEIGQERQKFNGLVAQIPNSNARRVIDTIADSLLKPRPWDQSAGKMYSRLAAAEVITKMVFSPLKVPFHLVHSGLLLEQYRPVFKALFMTATNYREMRERAIFSGALMEQVRAELMLEQGTDLKLAHQFLTVSGFNSLYKLDRIIANSAAQQWMENYALPKLIRNGKNALHIREQLKNKLLMEDSQIDRAIKEGRWTNEDLAHGGVALANKAMFTNDPTELPPAWRARADDPVSDSVNMALRAATVLKSFTFKTAAILKEQLIDEAKRGNFRPWIPFLLAYPVAGEALKLTSAFGRTVAQKGEEILTGSDPQATALDKYTDQLQQIFDDPSMARLANRWLDDVAAATGLTMFSHVIDVLFFPSEEKRKARFQAGQLAKDELEEIAGPIYGDIWNWFESIFDVTSAATIEEGEARQKKMSRAWRRAVRQQFPLTRDFIQANPQASYEMAPPP